MPVFTFSGKNASGAENQRRADCGQQAGPDQPVAARAHHARRDPGKRQRVCHAHLRDRQVKTKDIAIFFRQFSVMIDAGLPLVQCLEILAANQENPAFQKTLNGVRTTVEGGATLANAMRSIPRFSTTSPPT